MRGAVTRATLLLAVGALLPATAAGAARGPDAALGFELEQARVKPRQALFDGPRPISVRYRFDAARPTKLVIRVVDRRRGRVVAAWRRHAAAPGKRYRRTWNGVDRRGRAAADGHYEVRIGPPGTTGRYAGRFELHGHVFPVDGPHGERGAVGEFGAGRSGGRVHEGFDILAACGTRLVAARGGRVRKVGFDPVLYGWYVLVDGRKTNERYFYSHLIRRPSVERGERVQTGGRVGFVGQTGNAASTPCHLHFELRIGRTPIDPKPALSRWDRWS